MYTAADVYLDLAVFDGEEDEEGQHADDDGGQDEDGGAHHPVERQQTGPAVLARVAALGARQTLEHVRLVVPRRQALRSEVTAGSPRSEVTTGSPRSEVTIGPLRSGITLRYQSKGADSGHYCISHKIINISGCVFALN